MSKKGINTLVRVVRYMPPLFALTMCVHCALLYFGIEVIWSEVLLGLLVFVCLYVLSWEFGFCRLHRMALIYGYAVYFCCNFERGIGFGYMRRPMQLLMLIIGVTIVLLFIYKLIKRNTHHE